MLYKHDRLEKKLREHGRGAPAEILSIRTEGSGNSARAQWSDDDDLTTSWFLCRLQLRVTPQGELPFEVTVRTRLNTLKSKGDTVPVFYDPDDHDKVVVDYQRDAKAAMDGMAALREVATPHTSEAGGDPELAALLGLEAEEKASGSSPVATPRQGSPTRLDQLQQLADLRDRGVLSDEEFAAEKAKIMDES